jgi:sugar phosphate permease
MTTEMHYTWIIAITGILGLLLAQGFGKMSYTVILPFMKDGLSLTYTQIGLIGTGNFIGYLVASIVGGVPCLAFRGEKNHLSGPPRNGCRLVSDRTFRFLLLRFCGKADKRAGERWSPGPDFNRASHMVFSKEKRTINGRCEHGSWPRAFLDRASFAVLYQLLRAVGWKSAWYLMGVTVFLCSFVCYVLLRDHPSEKGLTVYSQDGPNEHIRSQQTVTLGSAIRSVLVQGEIWKLSSVYRMFGFSYMVYLTFFIAYLTKELGMRTTDAGRIFALLGFLSVFCGLPWGALSDRIGGRHASALGYLAPAISFLLFAFYREPPGAYLSAAIFGLTAFAIPVIVYAAVSDAVGGQLATAGFGFVTLFFGIGQAVAPFIGGWINDTTGTFTAAFVLCAVVAIIGAFCSCLLKGRV